MSKPQIFVQGTIDAVSAATDWFAARSNFFESVSRDIGKIMYTTSFSGNLIIQQRFQTSGMANPVIVNADVFDHEDNKHSLTFDLASGCYYRVVGGADFSGSTDVIIFSGREVE